MIRSTFGQIDYTKGSIFKIELPMAKPQMKWPTIINEIAKTTPPSATTRHIPIKKLVED
jgi:hypothetical protein